MNAIGILGCLTLLLVLEALNDGFVFLSWTAGKWRMYGILAHLAQLIFIFAIFVFGYLYPYEFFSLQSLFVLIIYVALRFAFFDLFYNFVTGNPLQGSTDIFDIISSKVPILQNPVLRLFICAIAVFLTIQFL